MDKKVVGYVKDLPVYKVEDKPSKVTVPIGIKDNKAAAMQEAKEIKNDYGIGEFSVDNPNESSWHWLNIIGYCMVFIFAGVVIGAIVTIFIETFLNNNHV